MRTISTDVFTFDELTAEAQEKAIEDIRCKGWATEFFSEDADLMLDWIKEEKAEPQGIEVRDVSWTDYGWANFHVSLALRFDLAAFMKAHKLAGKYRLLYNVACDLNSTSVSIYDASTDIKHYGGNSHGQGEARIEFNFWNYYQGEAKLTAQAAAVEEAMDEAAKALKHEFEDALNKELEYKESDEYIRELIEGNDWEFTEDGSWA